METIKFMNDSIYSVKLQKYTNQEQTNRIQIIFYDDFPDDNTLISGFYLLNEHNNQIIGDYTSYTNLYFMNDKKYILSDTEGDIYVAPTPTPSIPTPEPTLEEIKASKLQDISNMCAMAINCGVTVPIDGTDEHFSYTTAEDQANIKELFDGAIQTGCSVPYHSDGNSCKSYTAEQMVSIYVSCATLKTSHTTYHNQLKEYIATLTDKDEISNVQYGQALTGIYLENYTNLMKVASDMMDVLLSKKAW